MDYELKLIESPIENALEKIMEGEKLSRKINLHSSNIKNYYKCPHLFTLSRAYDVEKSSSALQAGLLFEGYVFGFKNAPGYSEFEIRGLKYNKPDKYGKVEINQRSGKTDMAVEPIKKRAGFVRQFFDNGKPFVKLEYDGNFRNGKLKGEADFIGEVWVDVGLLDVGNEETRQFHELLPRMAKRRVIADLKDTGEIFYRWNFITKQTQVIQSILYPYIWFKMTGELVDFLYFVVWNKSENIIKQIYFKTTMATIELAESLIAQLENDLLKRPRCNAQNCLKGEYNSPCEYISFCEDGRDLIAGSNYFEACELEKPFASYTDEQIEEVFNNLDLEDI